MLGAALLWFGWFGFNAGSAVGSNGVAAAAFVTTVVATCAAMLAWLMVEKIRDGHATTLGGASGIVAGLVAITPACSSVDVVGAIVIGVVAGALCALAVGLKYRFGYDDSLDVVGVHLVGGLVGTLLVGLVATEAAPAGVNGLFYGGGLDQLWRQAVGAGAVLVYSCIATAVIALIVKVTIGLRVSAEAEARGVDEAEHAESAYDFVALAGRPGPGARTGARNCCRQGGMSHEADHRNRQAVHARGRQDRTRTGRCSRYDGQRGPGVRAAEGAHRGLSGRRVLGRLRPEGSRRGRCRGFGSRQGRRGHRRGRPHGEDR